MDENFGRPLPGKASLRSSPSSRSGVREHYLHANALAQAYFVSTEERGALRGKPVVLEKTTYSLQSIVAKQLMKLIQDVEIINTGEDPGSVPGPRV